LNHALQKNSDMSQNISWALYDFWSDHDNYPEHP